MEIISIEAPNDSREVSTFRVEEGVADVFPTDLESVGLPKISRALSEVSSGIMLSRDMQSSDILDCSGHQRVPSRRKFSLYIHRIKTLTLQAAGTGDAAAAVTVRVGPSLSQPCSARR